jgi:hypothetical protein
MGAEICRELNRDCRKIQQEIERAVAMICAAAVAIIVLLVALAATGQWKVILLIFAVILLTFAFGIGIPCIAATGQWEIILVILFIFAVGIGIPFIAAASRSSIEEIATPKQIDFTPQFPRNILLERIFAFGIGIPLMLILCNCVCIPYILLFKRDVQRRWKSAGLALRLKLDVKLGAGVQNGDVERALDCCSTIDDCVAWLSSDDHEAARPRGEQKAILESRLKLDVKLSAAVKDGDVERALDCCSTIDNCVAWLSSDEHEAARPRGEQKAILESRLKLDLELSTGVLDGDVERALDCCATIDNCVAWLSSDEREAAARVAEKYLRAAVASAAAAAAAAASAGFRAAEVAEVSVPPAGIVIEVRCDSRITSVVRGASYVCLTAPHLFKRIIILPLKFWNIIVCFR